MPRRIPGTKIGIITEAAINVDGYDFAQSSELLRKVQIAIDIVKDSLSNESAPRDIEFEALELVNEEI